jgi:flagellar biogenesis protein FliO
VDSLVFCLADKSETLLSSLGLKIFFFLVLLGLLAFLLTKLTRSKVSLMSGAPQGKIQILDCKPLGNRQFIFIAKYENEKHMLGVSPGNIQHLAKFMDSSQSTQNSRES